MAESTLILDMGNVVFSLNFEAFENWFRRTVRGDKEPDLNGYWEIYFEYEKNGFGDKEFMARVADHFDAAFSEEEFVDMWCTCWECDMPGLDTWLDQIEGSLPIHILSNTNGLHMERFLAEKKVLQRFDRLFLSHEMGCRKPEAEIYEKVAIALKVEPSSILFFDDRPENVVGGQKSRMGGRDLHRDRSECLSSEQP